MQCFRIPISHSHTHTCSNNQVCDDTFYEVISVSHTLHMSVITQDGDSALILATRKGRTEVVSQLLEAGAKIHLQNEVKYLRGGVVLMCVW